jgi:hypothetical protein
MEAENDFDWLMCMPRGTFKIVRRREGTGRQNSRGDVLFAAVRHPVKRDFSSLFFWTGKRKGAPNAKNTGTEGIREWLYSYSP